MKFITLLIFSLATVMVHALDYSHPSFKYIVDQLGHKANEYQLVDQSDQRWVIQPKNGRIYDPYGQDYVITKLVRETLWGGFLPLGDGSIKPAKGDLIYSLERAIKLALPVHKPPKAATPLVPGNRNGTTLDKQAAVKPAVQAAVQPGTYDVLAYEDKNDCTGSNDQTISTRDNRCYDHKQAYRSADVQMPPNEGGLWCTVPHHNCVRKDSQCLAVAPGGYACNNRKTYSWWMK